MKRFLALALAFVMVFSVMAGAVQTALAAAGDPIIVGEVTGDALHFIIRHWHNDGVASGATGNHYFDLIEGYMVPDGDDSCEFYFVDGDTVTQSVPESVTTNAGDRSVTLKASPVSDLEEFSAFSISAGHNAITYGDDSITITYSPDVHLVKGHVFYLRKNDLSVAGSKEGFENPEKDTREEEETKLYNTNEGLHTDKTASLYTGNAEGDQQTADPLDDGRTFNLELEAWYNEGNGAQVGMVLDASGSMGFTSDPLEPINVLKVLGIESDGNGGYRDADGNTIGVGHEYYSIVQKIGAIANVADLNLYPQLKNLIGYYSFGEFTASASERYVLDVGIDLSDLVGQTGITGTRTAGTNNRFTIRWKTSGNGSSVVASSVTFDDGYAGSAYINFQGGATTTASTIAFITTEDSVMKVWWVPSDAGRQMAILNSSGSLVTMTSEGPNGESEANTGYVSSIILGSGTYYLDSRNASGGQQNGNRIYKVEVVSLSEYQEYDLKAADLTDGTTPEKAGTDDYFTIHWGSNPDAKVGKSGNVTWADGYSSDTRISFNGVTNACPDRTVEFTISNPAAVKIWWVPGNAGRNMVILNENGETVAGPTTLGNSTGNYISSIMLKEAGTYYIGNAGGNNYIYRVMVAEEPPAAAGDLDNTAPGKDGSAELVAQQPQSGFSFNDSVASDIAVTSKGLNLKGLEAGVKLDAVPASGSFTISFSITGGEHEPTFNNLLDILYVGPLNETNNYVKVQRRAERPSWIYVSPSGSQSPTGVEGAINENKHFVTLVYENGTLACYTFNSTANSYTALGHVSLTLTDFNIILNGFISSYDGDDLYIDDIFVYDTALSEIEVRQLFSAVKTQSANGLLNADFSAQKDSASIDWNDVFLDLSDDELNLILNTRNTDNSRLSSSGYSYFVYNPRSSVVEFAPLGYWDGITSLKPSTATLSSTGKELTVYIAETSDGDILGTFSNQNFEHQAGWYYINPTSNWETNYDNEEVQSGKTLNGIQGSGNNLQFTDTVTIPSALLAYYQDAYPQTVAPNNGDTDAVYTASTNTPTRFYIDKYGYLRCFFATGTTGSGNDKQWNTSYVFLLEDIDYIKVESLQRALGSFVTALEEAAHSTEVAAVRFSTEQVPDSELEKLVLLQWTNDASVSANILSLTNGAGTQGDGEGAYNYGLTGGTTTRLGLKAFTEQLHDSDSEKDKYLIIFTDGKDTELKSAGGDYELEDHPAISLAQGLKDEGYTIFTVMLAGGPVRKETDDPNAKAFLVSLSGEEHFYFVEDVDELTNAFLEKILPEIAHNLLDYTVEDTIDPRFDLVDAEGVVWRLNADGEIVKGGETIKVSATDGAEITLSEAKDVDPSAYKATLYFRDGLYYLKWEGQTIPASPVGDDAPLVWRARVTVRAKDDFISGNAVLTNGNDAKMNWVYYAGDTDATSGTDDTMKEYDADGNVTDPYPSKGFPRTVVNVPPVAEHLTREQLIYMGETLSPSDVAQRLVTEAWLEVEDSELAKYYWEYLVRYSKQKNEKLEDLVAQILTGSLTVPYSYLPNAEGTNQAGTKEHWEDVVGELVYRVVEETNYSAPDYVTKDTNDKVSKLTVTFAPVLLKDEESGEELRKPDNDDLVQEEKYAWDPEYKPAVGAEQKAEVLVNGMYTTRIIAGEIVLQMVIPQHVIAALQGYGMAGQTITYAAKLRRSYGSISDDVGAFTLTYTIPADTPSADGLVSVNLSQIAFESAYEYAKAYGLPIGDYTVVKDEANTPSSPMYSFSGVIHIPALTTAGHANFFSLYPQKIGKTMSTAEMSLSDFLAAYSAGSSAPRLGTDDAGDQDYRNERYALLQVTVELGTVVGNLAVSKVVSGDGGDQQQAFNFMIMLSDTGVNGVYGDVSFTNGVASFTLKHGETKTATGLPVGIRYSVSESNAEQDGYAVTVTGGSGLIPANETVTAVFMNTRDKPDVPQTGDNSHLELWLALLLASAIGACVSALTIRKRTQRR